MCVSHQCLLPQHRGEDNDVEYQMMRMRMRIRMRMQSDKFSPSQRFFNQVDQLVPVIQVLPAIMIIIIIILTIICYDNRTFIFIILTTGLFIFINIMTMIISICNKMIPRQPYLGWRAQERLKLSSSYLNPPTQVIIIVIIIS